jgi:putative hydrolase of the HAD superfamily
MTGFTFPVGCIAVDFGGTLAGRGDEKADGTAFVAALAQCAGWSAPDGFTDSLDQAMKAARSRDRASLRQTSFVDIMCDAASKANCTLPDVELWSERVFEYLPDARIDDAAARAVRDLAERGVRLVLASNTRWPVSARSRTLLDAGIGDAFHALILSTGIGVLKPHPDFYRAVLDVAGCPAGEVLFVGDTADKDIDPPRSFGMQTLLVAPVWEREQEETSPRVPYFAELPALLEAGKR